MNAAELELVIDLATAGERYTPEQYAATKTAERDLAAMRQTITAEALKADGWKEEGAGYVKMLGKYTGFVFGFRNSGGNVFWYVEPDGWGNTRFVEIVNDIPNMYDLRELVRLLGGSQ